jgi:hypothetical protein
MAGSSTSTVDHDFIRRWTEERGGHPAHVAKTGKAGGDVGVLRIDFPGYSGEETLEAISWEQFFDKFEDAELEFVYQEKTGDGALSRFNKLVHRGSA